MAKNQVRKTTKMRLIEESYGLPIEQVMRGLYKTMTLQEMTRHFQEKSLGVSIGTLSMWLLKFGIETRRWIHPDEINRGKEVD